MKTTSKTIVIFYIGRGGRSNNQGHLFYVGTLGTGYADVSTGALTDNLFLSDDGLNYTENNGHEVESVEAVESGIFSLNLDGQYDTTYTGYLDDINQQEAEAIINAEKSGAYVHDEVISFAKKLLV